MHPTADHATAPTLVPSPSVPGGALRWLHRAEALCGLCMATLFLLMVAGLGAYGIYVRVDRSPLHVTIAFGATCTAFTVMELALVAWMKQAYDRDEHPLPTHLATAQPAWPLPLRPLAAAWWLAHAVALLLLGELLYRTFRMDTRGEPALGVAITVLRGFALFGAAYATNVYLLLAVASIHRNRSLIETLWRWRLVIDAALAALVLLLPRR